MTYLLFEILISLVVVATASFSLGWVLRGLKTRSETRFHGE